MKSLSPNAQAYTHITQTRGGGKFAHPLSCCAANSSRRFDAVVFKVVNWRSQNTDEAGGTLLRNAVKRLPEHTAQQPCSTGSPTRERVCNYVFQRCVLSHGRYGNGPGWQGYGQAVSCLSPSATFLLITQCMRKYSCITPAIPSYRNVVKKRWAPSSPWASNTHMIQETRYGREHSASLGFKQKWNALHKLYIRYGTNFRNKR